MTSPVIDAINGITAKQISITWVALPTSSNGGDLIIYYSLEWDQGVSTLSAAVAWTELTSPADSNVTLRYAYT